MSFFINILANSCFNDASNAPLSGTLTITPSSKFRFGGGGQSTSKPVTREIINGSLTQTLQLADPAQTSPQGIGYNFQFTDSGGRSDPPYNNVLIVADANGNFDLAQLNTGQFLQAPPPRTVISLGASVSNNFTLSSTTPVSQYQAVTASGKIASSDNAPNGGAVAVATQSVTSGSFNAQQNGTVTNSSWNWNPNQPVFLGLQGQLTQVVPALPSNAFLQVVGTAISATELLVSPQPPIILA